MANEEARAVRQAARRRARARGRADAGAAVRHPAARPARRRRREGRAPGARRVGPGVARRRCSIPTGRKVGATFLRNNLDKRSVGIDLKAPEGRELFLALVPHFDVVAENFKAGTMDRMGLGYDDDRRRRTRGAIYVSISGFGNTVETPYRDWPAYASIVEAMSGIYDYKRVGDEPPVHDPGRRARRHQLRRCSRVIGILAALRHRDRTGEGQYVDIAMFDAMVAMTDIVTNFWSLGVRPEPDKPLEVICDGFRASDG